MNFVDKTTKELPSPAMKIISVIPIDRGIPKDHLSYFSKIEIPLGSLIEIPIKNRSVPALVVSQQNASDLKSELRSQGFMLKKINSTKAIDLFLPEFIEACMLTAQYFVSPIGLIIKNLTPTVILEEAFKLEKTTKTTKETDIDLNTRPDIYILQEPDEERLAFYKNLIRESFAKQQSVFICSPTIPDIEKISPYLEKGISPYTFVLHSRITKKKILETWHKTLKTKHPILVIATPLFLSLPRRDIGTIIVDRENSSAYKTNHRPFFDIRNFLEYYTRTKKIKLIFGDIALRTETIFRQGTNDVVSLVPPKYRSFSDADQELISMQGETDELKKETPLFGQKTKQIILKAIKNNERVFLFTARRGGASMTICNDCGLIISCQACHTPLIIHRDINRKYHFVCHKCRQHYKIEDRCPSCQGWRLAMYGGGSDRLEEEIGKLIPNTSIYKIDSDSTTSKKAPSVAKNFYTQGGVLIGTEMALNYLTEKIDHTFIISIDSLFALPDFRISEKIFATLIRVKELAKKSFIIQTHNPKEKVFEHVLKGSLLDFYREEINERKNYSYPPFTILIKITREGPKEIVIDEMNRCAEILKAYEPAIYPAFTEMVKNNYRLHALIKIPPEKWIDQKLAMILKSLPSDFKIIVDPEEIL